MTADALVIGAGWSGLAAAHALARDGHSVTVLEKARGPGGRSATRREKRTRFDHGAQYFTVHGAAFARYVGQWQDLALVEPWQPRLAVIGDRHRANGDPAPPRFVARPGMNGVCRHLAAGLDCRFGARVVSVRHDSNWQVSVEGGDAPLSARALIVTAPPAGTAALLGAGDPLAAGLDQVPFEPCLTAMLALDANFDPGFDAAFVNLPGALTWIARDSSKPGRETGGRYAQWVLHAGPEWSRARFDLPDDAVLPAMLEAFADRIRARCGSEPPRPRTALMHRWRFARCTEPLDDTVLFDADRRLAIAGDWLCDNRIEGAWTSGRAAARALTRL